MLCFGGWLAFRAASCPFAPAGTREKREGVSATSSLDAPGWMWLSGIGAARGGAPPRSHPPPSWGGCSAGADAQGYGQAASLLPAVLKPGTPASQPQPGPAKNHPHEHQLWAKSCPATRFPSPSHISFPSLFFFTFSIHCSRFWGQRASSSCMSPTRPLPPLSCERPRGSMSQGSQHHHGFSPGCRRTPRCRCSSSQIISIAKDLGRWVKN